MHPVLQAMLWQGRNLCWFCKQLLGNAGGEKGQGLIEYTVIMMLVALACVGGLTLFGGSVAEMFNRIRSGIP